MNDGDSPIKFARRHTTLDIWMGMVSVILNMDSSEYETIYLPVASSQYYLTCRDFTHHTAHNDFKIRKLRSSGLLNLASGTDPISRLKFPASCIYTHYPLAEKKRLAELLRVEELRILSFSAFVRSRYLQHARYGWHGSHNVRFPHVFVFYQIQPKRCVGICICSSFCRT